MLDEAKARELSLNEQVQELQRQLQEAAEAAEAEEEALKDGEQMVGGAAAAAALEILEQQREVEAKVLRRVGEVAQQNGSLTQELSGAKGDLESSRAEVKELRLQVSPPALPAALCSPVTPHGPQPMHSFGSQCSQPYVPFYVRHPGVRMASALWRIVTLGHAVDWPSVMSCVPEW